jgi:hypothetical protein
MSLFHSNTELLIDYWRRCAPMGGLPPRTAIDPTAFAPLLPQVFVLGRTASGVYPVRLAGGFVADLHKSDLRRRNGLSLWSERDRPRLHIALEEARLRPEPLVATAEILTDGPSIGMEVLFAPLAGVDGGPDRFLGLYQPLSMVARLLGRPALELSVRRLRRGGPANEEAPRIRLATLDGRRIA